MSNTVVTDYLWLLKFKLVKIKSISDWCWSWSSNTLATWCEELTHWKRPWCFERLKARGEGDNRGWDGWMASLTQWTRIWASSGRWWRTGKPGVLQSMGLQRVGHDWVTGQQQEDWKIQFPSHQPHFRYSLVLCGWWLMGWKGQMWSSSITGW